MTYMTSRKQVPAAIKRARELVPGWRPGLRVLNFGCGRWPRLAEKYLVNRNIGTNVVNYDPNSPDADVISDITELTGHFDVVYCCNVVNVCEKLGPVLRELAQISSSVVVIQVYQGDKSGNGGKTRDGYQRNERTQDYLPAIKQAFGTAKVSRRGNTIIIIGDREG